MVKTNDCGCLYENIGSRFLLLRDCTVTAAMLYHNGCDVVLQRLRCCTATAAKLHCNLTHLALQFCTSYAATLQRFLYNLAAVLELRLPFPETMRRIEKLMKHNKRLGVSNNYYLCTVNNVLP